MTLSINDTQDNWTLSVTMLFIMLSVVMLKVEFIYCYDECHYAECRYAGCRGATQYSVTVLYLLELFFKLVRPSA
jgi:hypothetical protein